MTDTLSRMREIAAQGLHSAAAAAGEGVPGPSGEGQLIRPLVALAGVADPAGPPEGFWDAALAVQLAHEASLLHDDVIDAADTRRGRPTAFAQQGVAAALLRGDHLLAAGYRAAARSGSLVFAALYARAVERTIAAEGAQGRGHGELIGPARYDAIATGKAGELMGCALAAAAVLQGRPDAECLFALGRRVGLLYQHLDDLLDYCPAAQTGKPALGDYATGRWTRVLEPAGLGFGRSPDEVLAALHAPAPGGSAMSRVLAALEAEAAELRQEIARTTPNPEVLIELVDGWAAAARRAVAAEVSTRGGPSATGVRADAIRRVLQSRTLPTHARSAFFARNSRSFRFAARFFSRADADRVAGVYAYCRVTDDLADLPPPGFDGEELLDAWTELSRRAHAGIPTGLALLDGTLGEMGARGIPFAYAAELVEGMRMDLRGERYESLDELRAYTHRVASVVGLWLSRLFGITEPALLERAAQLGHAMQLTNILRDVGEDWQRGRLYLPADRMDAHRISAADLAVMCAGGPIPLGYRALVEELMQRADADYAAALTALPSLPPGFARPVAVAAHLYRGIHAEIRRNGYDNLRRRAHTGALTKGALAVKALWKLHQASRGDPRALVPAAAS